MASRRCGESPMTPPPHPVIVDPLGFRMFARNDVLDLADEIGKLRAENARLADELREARERISQLEAWVREEGDRGNVCTYHILNKEICNGCLCGRLPK